MSLKVIPLTVNAFGLVIVTVIVVVAVPPTDTLEGFFHATGRRVRDLPITPDKLL